ncbi:GEVED domain-containing protein [Tenacibaculum halocynthiae]|uniref:GEVED domain-containing protein n=1 Tax=Tenacibaculum halocynthiae TaxID=1254437 RepID=UPI003893F8ED
MKRRIILALTCLFFVGANFAQEKRNCHAMENLEHRQSQDPLLKERMQKIEAFTQKRVKEMQNTKNKIVGNVIQLPVVVHVIYSNSQENISVAQIQSQIDVLNEDFRRTNADKTNKWSQAADTEIEFYLAKVDPNGNPTTGITRKSSTKTSWGTSDAMKKLSQGGVNPWNTAEYLNMWVCNIGGGILGYAQFPGGSAATDGVVMSPQYFGSKDKGTGFYLAAKFDKGRTTTHEVGHFLNLRHIWGDGACGTDDFVSDTPESDAANYGCVTGHTSCGSEDMVQNYMDYSDDACMNLYTAGQKTRMRAVLDAGGVRRSLALSDKTGGSTACTATVPTGVSTSSVTSSGASVSWTAVSGATYDVRYRQTGTSSWTTNAVTGTSTSLSGLSASTQYEVQVRSKCTSGNSAYSASVNFTTPVVTISYCSSKGNSVSDEYIQKVELGSISNTSTRGNGYTDHTSISTNLAKGTSHSITITPKWTGTVYNEGYGVFIDYNKDGDFSDSGETVWTKAASKDTSVSGSFTVPSGASEGATRMRVILRYNAVPSACGSYNYGETEDYTVVIGSAQADTQAPSAPSSLAASSVSQTSLSLGWTASTDNVGVTGYDVYRGSTKIGSTTTATSYNVTGLTANTAYTFSVKAKDAASNESSSSNVVNVTTLSNTVSYCASKGNNINYEWIDYVSFGGMTNTTGANGGYGDFTSKTATVAQGSTNQLIVSAGFTSTAYNEYYSIWIDYNQNGTFESSEKVASGNSTSSGNLSYNVNVPSGASLGTTRMRVSMKWNAAQTACEAFSYGEVEDYTVNITSNVSRGTILDNVAPLTNENVLDLMAYPSPATNFVQVKLASRAENSTYRITNTIGSVVLSGDLNSSILNVSKLNSGVYILEVNDGQKSLTTKFIKK